MKVAGVPRGHVAPGRLDDDVDDLRFGESRLFQRGLLCLGETL